MKAIIYGKGQEIEKQYASCITYAMSKGYETTETFTTIPDVIERLSKRDISVVIVDNVKLLADNDYEYEIIKSTFARYGSFIEITK